MSIDVGSPFDYRKQGIMYVAGDLKPPGFGVHEGQLERLRELCEASEGGALGLFSSKRAAERAAEYMREHSDLNILLQVSLRSRLWWRSSARTLTHACSER